MGLQDTIGRPGLPGSRTGAEAYSEAWWHERSADELRLMMNRGAALGSSFDGAAAEVERRARKRLDDEEQAATAKDAFNHRMRRMILEGSLLACLLVVIAIALTR